MSKKDDTNRIVKLFNLMIVRAANMSVVATIFFTAGCKGNGGIPDPYNPEEQEVKKTELNFGIETSASRTIYDPSVNPDHLPDLPYRLLWVNGKDNVAVYSDKAASSGPVPNHLAVYTSMTLEGTSTSSYAGLEITKLGHGWTSYPIYKILGENNLSLRWDANSNGTGITEHEFFAAYPAEMVVSHPGLTDNGRTFELEYPTSQTVTVSKKNGTVTCTPNMKLAYMMARKSVREVSDRVLLSFFPVITTLNISFTQLSGDKSQSELPRITGLSLILPQGIETDNLQYAFKSYPVDDRRRYNPTAVTELCEINGYCEMVETVFAGFYEESLANRFITLSEGERIECMMFIPPFPDLEANKVRIKLHMAGCHDFTLPLAGEGVSYSGANNGFLLPFSRIEINLPSVNPMIVRPNNWMRRIDQSTLLTDMSLPGISCRGIAQSGLSHDDIKNSISYLLKSGTRVIDIRELCELVLSDSGDGEGEFDGVIDGIGEFVGSFSGDSESEPVILLTRECANKEGLFSKLSLRTSQCQRYGRNKPEDWSENLSVENFNKSTLADLVAMGPVTIIDEYINHDSGQPGYLLLDLNSKIVGDISRFAAFTEFEPCQPVSQPEEIIRMVDSSEIESGYRRLFDLVSDATGSYATTGIMILPSPFVSATYLEESRSDLVLAFQGIIDCNYRFRKRRAK